MENIGALLSKLSSSGTESSFDELMGAFMEQMESRENMTPEELLADNLRIAQQKCDRENRKAGNLNVDHKNSDDNMVPGDGYDCPLCLNRGYNMAVEVRNGTIYEVAHECKCMTARRSIWRLKRSGLGSVIRDYRFDNFEATEPWQRNMLETAQRYIEHGARDGRWFFVGGQPGCGKSHLCTAMSGKLIKREHDLIYVIWPEVSKRLKASVTDAAAHKAELGRLQEIDVLYIDDLFKPVGDSGGTKSQPSAADMRLAFELLNFRYVNRLPTILSSEWYANEILDMDEAIGSRIIERCGGGYSLSINRDRNRNHRIKPANVM